MALNPFSLDALQVYRLARKFSRTYFNKTICIEKEEYVRKRPYMLNSDFDFF